MGEDSIWEFLAMFADHSVCLRIYEDIGWRLKAGA